MSSACKCAHAPNLECVCGGDTAELSKPALRPGQKVTLTAAVMSAGSARTWIRIFDAWVASDADEINVPTSALAPVVEPEPEWCVGDLIRVNGRYLLARHVPDSDRPAEWLNLETGGGWKPPEVSELWQRGGIEILHKEPTDERA